MQRNVSRHLAPFFEYIEAQKKRTASKKLKASVSTFETAIADSVEPLKFPIPPEFTGKDYLAFLISIDAELEHGLMLQYLYAAYSMGGPDVPEKYQAKVREWQEVILGIAKEEMGHFVSVQNVLRLIGAPLHFDRQDYPWDTPFYPFPFKLEKLTLESLAKYVYAESPIGWIDSDDEIAKEIKAIINAGDHGDPISELFKVILQLIQDTEAVPDEVFQPATYPYQAKFDEWGRGYAGGKRGNTAKGNPKGAPDVLVAPMSSRDDAYNALLEISEQGEAPSANENAGLPSHFERFLRVYTEMRALPKNRTWEVARDLATNPYLDDDGNPNSEPAEGLTSNEERDLVTNPEAVAWSHLSNVRYRMLLTFIIHSFKLDGGLNNAGAFSPRGTIINATFGEMYNIRSIANVLVQFPIAKDSCKMAGPPFQIPYSLNIPMEEHDRWRLHRDLIMASNSIVDGLKRKTSGRNLMYLNALQEADAKLLSIIDQLTSPK